MWQESGSMDHWDRAKMKAVQLLQNEPSYIDPEIDAAIRQKLPIL